MRVKFDVIPYVLDFKFLAGTSRGTLKQKPTWFIKSRRADQAGFFGLGEASPLKGLSIDYSDDYGAILKAILDDLEEIELPEAQEDLLDFLAKHISQDLPSIRFGIETSLMDLFNGGQRKLFDNDFFSAQRRIPINGLVWMGDADFMQQQIEDKLKAGFNTIKMKVGAINFDEEFALLAAIRERYSANDITLRVDANGAFDETNIYERLEQLASLELHSIEQPIQPGQAELMRELCESAILPIALDEELIGVKSIEDKELLLTTIQPQYIILKPSLLGGIKACQDWIDLANEHNVDWWMTSMLESNVGLNAIAQFTAEYDNLLPQGLGTGQLYQNNIDSPLQIRRGKLFYNKPIAWDLGHKFLNH